MHHSSIRRWTLATLLASLPLLAACNTVRDVTGTRLSSDDDGGGGDTQLSDVDEPDADGLDADRPDLDASADVDTSPSDVADDVLRDPDAVTLDVADEPDVARDLADEPDTASEDVADEPDLPAIPTGPIALYTFEHGSGTTVLDRSEVAPPADLEIEGAAVWISGRDAVATVGFARMISQDPPRKLFDRITATGEFSVEAWVRPGRTDQRGPSRIVSYSADWSTRNFTLAQQGSEVAWRVRTVDSTDNGTPTLYVGTIETKMTHLFVTKGSNDLSRVYEDGELIGTRDLGALNAWDPADALVIANEQTDRRATISEFYQVAVFDRQLSLSEIAERFDAGPAGVGPDTRTQVSFVEDVVEIVEGDDAMVHLSATPPPSSPIEIHYEVDRGRSDVTGLSGTTTIGVDGTGVIDLHATIDDFADGPESAVITLISGPDYTSSGTVIAEIRVADADFTPPMTPLVWLSGAAHGRLTGEPVYVWPNVAGGPAALAHNSPYFNPDGPDGRGTITFQGWSSYYEFPEGFEDWSAGVTAVVVAVPNRVIIDDTLLDFSNEPSLDTLALHRDADTCDLVYQVSVGGTDDVLIAPGALCVDGGAIYTVRQQAGASGESPDATIFVDGVAAATATMALPTNVPRTSCRLGHGPGTAQTGFSGDIPEVLIYNRSLTDVELNEVHAYLKAKYFPER